MGVGKGISLTAALMLTVSGMALAGHQRHGFSSDELENGRYIVYFSDDPVAAFEGVRSSEKTWFLEPTAPSRQSGATSGFARLKADSRPVVQYRQHLAKKRRDSLSAMANALQRELEVLHTFEFVANGVSTRLSPEEAQQLSQMPGVVSVEPVRVFRKMTDAGPSWIGAPSAWQTTGSLGEGVVVGVIDSGINWDHPAFADVGGDGFDHTNPRGQTLGLCSNAQVNCNDKLIGVYDFTEEGARIGRDLDGHGTHVASTVVGNIRTSNVEGITANLELDVSGVAPHANLISYKVCLEDDPATADDEGFCLFDAILDAVDQAVADAVDIVNYSIGGPSSNPWADAHAVAMLNARNAGVLVVTSAGNGGPEAATIASPANAPWLVAVGNSTHNRRFENIVQELTGGNDTPPGDLTGVGFTSGFGPARMVHARDFGNALCGAGDPELQPLCESHTGSSNPFAPGTFNGEIVVCDRGIYGRVEKGFNLRAAGAGGYVLANTVDQGESIVSDDHCLPAVHLGNGDGGRLRSWLASGGDDHRGVLSGQTQVLSDDFGDRVSSSSSRGPDQFVSDVLKPDIAAPGSNILAAGHQGFGSAFKSGTSMASPHAAGVAALVLSNTPGLSPSQLHSIVVTTAFNDAMVSSDGVFIADGFDVGGGRVRADQAVKAGLYLDVTGAEFSAANPNQNGVPHELNLPGMADDDCLGSCSFIRTVTDLAGGSRWTARVEGPDGVAGAVNPSAFQLTAGESQNLEISFDLPGAELLNTWVTGYVVLESDDPGLAITRLPFQLFSSPGQLPPVVSLETSQSRGSAEINLAGLAALPAAQYLTMGLSKGRDVARNLAQDPTEQDPYDEFATGTMVETITLNQSGGIVFARIIPASNRDIDLFVGLDSNGNGQPDQSEQLCESRSPQSVEQCVIEDAVAGTYWVLVQNFRSVTPDSQDRTTVRYAAVSPSGSGLVATGPGSVKSGGQSVPVRLIWDQGIMAAGDVWVGALQPKASRSPGIGKLGTAMVELSRVSDGSSGTADLPDLDDRDPVALVPGETTIVSLAPFQGHGGLFVDVPSSAAAMTVNVSGTDAFDLSVVRENAVFDAPRVAMVASLESPVAFTASDGGATSVVLSSGDLVPGRYYVVPVNRENTARVVEISLDLSHSGASVEPVQGLWFNPARDGAGFNLNLSDDQLIIEWYTYLEDGTPTWYLAQGPFAGDGDIWTADLLYFNWDDDSAAATPVGSAILTLTSPTEMIFSYRVNGLSGSEPYVPIVSDISCESNGTAVEQTGLWFLPATPGFGYSILSLAGQQVHINYLYDGQGFPRWVLGQGSDGDQNIVMSRFSGFCPSCQLAPVLSVEVGTNEVSFESPTAGTMTTNLVFDDDIQGVWSQSGPMSNLTSTIRCNQAR